LRSNVE